MFFRRFSTRGASHALCEFFIYTYINPNTISTNTCSGRNSRIYLTLLALLANIYLIYIFFALYLKSEKY